MTYARIPLHEATSILTDELDRIIGRLLDQRPVEEPQELAADGFSVRVPDLPRLTVVEA